MLKTASEGDREDDLDCHDDRGVCVGRLLDGLDLGGSYPLTATYDFLLRIDDAELRSEIRAVLTQLQLLSDAKATTIGRSAPSSERPVGPPEFRGLKSSDIPNEDRSLFEHYLARFQELARGWTSERKKWWFLLWEAEDALKRRTVPPTEAEREVQVALVLNRADESALIACVINDHEGTPALRVALALRVPIGWIEHVREQQDRDPDYGEPRPEWRKLDQATKASVVASLKQRGLTQEQAARKLGIGQRTVREWWHAEHLEAA